MDTMIKPKARARFRAVREGIDAEERGTMDRAICDAVIASKAFVQAQMVLLYYPIGSEVDVRPIAEAAWRVRKQVAFPRITGRASMDWHRVGSLDELTVACEARLAIPEPPNDPATLFLPSAPAEKRDRDTAALEPMLVVVPGVAYDRMGYRLGYGGGYYDVFLALLGESNANATTIGVVHPPCIVESLDALGLREDHDQKVDMLMSAELKNLNDLVRS